MASRDLDAKLKEIDALAQGPAREATAAQLAKAFKERNNYVVARAASAAAGLGHQELRGDLEAAFDRFLINAAKTDSQCWAKNAIAKALRDLGHTDAAVFLKGASHVQMEPVWGGQADSAITLRATCALALVHTTLPRRSILMVLVDLAADPEKAVRVDAVRAIAQLAEPEGVLLLRMKAAAGDAEPEVTGQCLAELLDISASEFLPFVKRFLDHSVEDLRFEAVHALGSCREHAAEQALLDVVASSPIPLAGAALAVLAVSRRRDELRSPVEELVRKRASLTLKDAFLKEFTDRKTNR